MIALSSSFFQKPTKVRTDGRTEDEHSAEMLTRLETDIVIYLSN